MSSLGLFHTVVSTLPIILGLVAFCRDGRIDPRNWVGKVYLATMLIGTITGFMFLPTHGFNLAQALSVLTLAVLIAGLHTSRGLRGPGAVQTVCFSASYLLLLVFATTEALTHLPLGHPFASSPTDPALLPVRVALGAAFVLGTGWQVARLRAASKPEPSLQSAEV